MSDNINNGFPVPEEPLTREEQYLSAIAGVTSSSDIPEKPLTRIEAYLNKIVENGGGGGGGTSDYTQLSNKPKINNTELDGNKTSADLGLQDTVAFEGTYNSSSNKAATMAAIKDGKLTGYAQSSGNVAATDKVIEAIGKVEKKADDNQSNIISIQSIVTGKNIFDKNTFIYDMERDSQTGELKANTNKYGVSVIIPVRNGKTLYFSKNGIAQAPTFIYTWDKSGTYIGRSSGTTTYTVPNNVGYISICIYYNDGRVNTYQAEYDALTAYTAFDYIYSNDLAQNINNITSFEILASVNMFGSIAGVGDSYTAGLSANSGGSTQTMTDQSYIATIGKRSGVTWHNYGVSGATAKTYITISSGLPAILSATADDLYIINLGQNDINVGSTVGTIADIKEDYTQNPDTYYGNMGSIIAQIKDHAPNAKMILVKSWLNTNKSGTETSYQSLDSAIAEIAAHFNIPCIAPFDDVFFNSTNYQNYRSQGHPTTMGYAMMGVAMERLLSKCIVANPSYFQFSTIG